MKKLAFLSIIAATTFISCQSDDDAAVLEENNVEAPANYTFTRDNQSTVSFSGQTTRILMAQETVSAFTNFDTATEASISSMFAHVEGANDFSDADLNASDKSVRSKVAASQDFFNANSTEATLIKNTFDGYIAGQVNEVFPNQNTLAEPGVAGQIADGDRTRYVNSNGLEFNQAFAKSLIGALMADQMLNNYLGTAVLDEANNRENNDNGITDGDSPYTTMEHKWDEAYGYIYGTSVNAANPNLTIGDDDSFLNEYTGRVNDDPDFNTIAAQIFDAFKLGRAAIVAKNYEVRDAQAAIIRQKISEVIAIRGIFYLQQGKNKIADGNRTGAFHALSEAYGFVYSLRFTRDTQSNESLFSRADVDNLLGQLVDQDNNGFWTLTTETIDAISQAIAAKYSFTVAQAASTN
ncbi:DUF4856 domain-containing protein [Patiriisocius marinistellae]|uniref:DUF4856 domain-containing protein n=1 Tax=Patiriisocius marinistellae TaxID=2494560 RepID=A0A5J4FZQ9_9FLAO|nr:DUF4856 domain-containing protein [Patiriisocius marinistellae]GEQ86732.1 DUF4856 domain-containing protein [Patiriisocius marinistellae]